MADLITVVAIDDEPLILDILRVYLARDPGLRLVATGTVGADLERLVAEHRPQVVLLDINLPPEPGADRSRLRPDVARAVLEQHPDTRIIVISSNESASWVEAVARSGAHGYLLKFDDLASRLPQAIRDVTAGQVVLSTRVAQALARVRPVDPDPITLDERQMETLQLLIRQPSGRRQDWANTLNLSVGGIDHRLTELYARLGAASALDAVIKALQLGLIRLPADD